MVFWSLRPCDNLVGMDFQWDHTSTGWSHHDAHLALGSTSEEAMASFVIFQERKLHQVHSATIVDDASYGSSTQDADGVLTKQDHVMLLIKTADCVPVYLWDSSQLALIHAGWRGIRSGIIHKLSKYFQPQHTSIVLGPAICSKHYEVGPDVYAHWLKEAPELEHAFHKHTSAPDKRFLDLKHLITYQLINMGFSEEQIISIPICTYASDLPSYRRDGSHKHRLWNYIYKK